MTDQFIEQFRTHSKFFALEAQFSGLAKYLKGILGFEPKLLLFYNKDGDGIAYKSLVDVNTARNFGRHQLKDLEQAQKILNDGLEIGKNYEKKTKELWQIPTVEENTLIEYFKEVADLLSKSLVYYELSSKDYTKPLEETINKSLAENGFQDVDIEGLISFDNSSLATIEERREWLEILKIDTPGVVEKRIKIHADKFGFLGASGGNPFGWSSDYYIDKWQQDLERREQIIHKIETSIEDNKKSTENKEKICKELPKVLSDQINILSNLSYFRFKMRECFTKGAYYSNDAFLHLYSKIRESEKTALSNELLRQLSLSDMISFLKDKKIDIANLCERYEYYTIIVEEGQYRCINGVHEKVKGIMDKKDETLVESFEGKVAYSNGIVEGKARVIDNKTHSLIQLKEAKEMVEGEILVTGMTHPNIILACEKASAIVTDEGGITCHAAIIAREFKVPCVIGVGNATDHIKNGSLISVDSVNGTVKIIN